MSTPRVHAPAAARRSTPGRVLRNANFRKLLVGGVASASGAATGNVIITWMLYATTHSAVVITVLGIVEFIPTLTIGVLAGALADRYDRRLLMVTADLLRAGLLGSLAAYVFVFGFNPVVVLIAVFLVASFASLFTPSSHALLPRILDKSETNDGNGVLEVGWTAAAFVGSPLGGFLLIALGVVSGLVYNSATFVISAIAISLISVGVSRGAAETVPGEPRRSLWADVRAGVAYLRSQTALFIITLSSTAGNFFTGMALTYVVVYASVVLHTSALVYGLMGGIAAFAWGAGSLLAGRLRTEILPGVWASVAWALSGVPFILLVVAPSVVLAVAALAAQSALTAIGNNVWRSTVQRTVPDALLGRLFSIDEAAGFAMIPAGVIVGGLVLLGWGVFPLYVIAGGGVVASGLVMFLSRKVRAWGTVPSGPLASA